MGKTALITGVTGQDGSYLAELLLGKGYEVHGIRRRASNPNLQRISHIGVQPHGDGRGIHLHYGDLTDSGSLTGLVNEIKPDEIYNLAAQSQVRISFENPEYTSEVDAIGPLKLLEAIRSAGLQDRTKFYQASSSEMYGNTADVPQDENTRFSPRSPYAVAKVFAYWMTATYREAYGIFACNGILFNHESPRRDTSFVTRKITSFVARYMAGLQSTLYLGNVEARRDWGYAPEYVLAMWKMLQADKPDDFVVATGETHSVRDLIEAAFSAVDVQIEWRGQGVDETGVDTRTGKVAIAVDPWYFRPAELDLLLGNPAKAAAQLDWQPTVKFSELVRIMVQSDIEIVSREQASAKAKPGHEQARA
jgi:GDPmannose 4,6-dehydratase